MNKIEIINSGLYSTIQDGGRKGMAFYGIPVSGFMDVASAQIANILVGNKKNKALIEMTSVGMAIRFHQRTYFSITGADMSPTLDGAPLPMYETLLSEPGSILKFKNAEYGLRSYLAIHGKWKIKKEYGSKSTYTYGRLGGINGAALMKGDIIEVAQKYKKIPLTIWPQKMRLDRINTIQISKGPEFEMIANGAFRSEHFKISNQSDRMGAVLDSKPIQLKLKEPFPSKPVFPGVIQCTPSGKLIVILQDGQTTGGYPRVAIIERKELDRFNQIPIGKEFKFVLD